MNHIARSFAHYLTFALAISALSFAAAQDLTAEEIIERLEHSAQTLQDATFLVTGRLIDVDGTTINLEIDVQMIPGEELVRAEFIQPDALADNVVIVDGQAVYNYLFLTNQVTILSIDDPDALGGLFPQAEAELESAAEHIDFAFDLDRLVRGWDVTVEGHQPSAVGNIYLLRFENQDLTASISQVNAQIIEQEWRPYRVEFLQEGGRLFAELVVTDFVRDPGLHPGDLRYFPPDAEIIDER